MKMMNSHIFSLKLATNFIPVAQSSPRPTVFLHLAEKPFIQTCLANQQQSFYIQCKDTRKHKEQWKNWWRGIELSANYANTQNIPECKPISKKTWRSIDIEVYLEMASPVDIFGNFIGQYLIRSVLAELNLFQKIYKAL